MAPLRSNICVFNGNISQDEIHCQSASVVLSPKIPEIYTERRISPLADNVSLFQTGEAHQSRSMPLRRLEIIYLLHSGQGHVATAAHNPKCTRRAALNMSLLTSGVFPQR